MARPSTAPGQRRDSSKSNTGIKTEPKGPSPLLATRRQSSRRSDQSDEADAGTASEAEDRSSTGKTVTTKDNAGPAAKPFVLAGNYKESIPFFDHLYSKVEHEKG